MPRSSTTTSTTRLSSTHMKTEKKGGSSKPKPQLGTRRFAVQTRDSTHIPGAQIRRLFSRGGGKRWTKATEEEARVRLTEFTKLVLEKSIIYCEHDRRRTLFKEDVLRSLQLLGRPMYFTEEDRPRSKKTKNKSVVDSERGSTNRSYMQSLVQEIKTKNPEAVKQGNQSEGFDDEDDEYEDPQE